MHFLSLREICWDMPTLRYVGDCWFAEVDPGNKAKAQRTGQQNKMFQEQTMYLDPQQHGISAELEAIRHPYSLAMLLNSQSTSSLRMNKE